MLKHLAAPDSALGRMVIIGANSFIGRALSVRLAEEKTSILSLGRIDVDLCAENSSAKLAKLLEPADTVVAISAKAPCRNVDDFFENAKITRCLTKALEMQPVSHLVNISSDAVYPDEPLPLQEKISAAPGSLHGAMHIAREIALKGLGLPLAILRPTLIYGASDPHNGYGPNQFRRKANIGEPIILFGEGEERRDHVDVEDVAELITRVLLARSTGTLNIATGTVTSFRDIAEKATTLSGKSVEISGSPRLSPMPHNGYRPFDPTATFEAFPDFTYTTLQEGMEKAQKLEFDIG